MICLFQQSFSDPFLSPALHVIPIESQFV